MEIKKSFKLVYDYKEEEFLHEQSEKGFNLVKYDGKVYTFEASNEILYYLVEFSYKELSNYEIKLYAKKGYNFVLVYKAEKGYYYFFSRKEPVNDLDRELKDRHALLYFSKQRVDRFSSVIFIASFGLFSYWYFTSYKEIYIFLLLLTALMGGYFGYIYLETIKRLSVYTKIIEEREGLYADDEGRR